MIDRSYEPTITRQAELPGMSRGMVYYLPRPVSAAALALMRRIDEMHLEHPCMGGTHAAPPNGPRRHQRGLATHCDAPVPHGH